LKSKKLLEKLNKLTGLGEDADKKEIKKLRKVLRALKEKQGHLEEKLEDARGEHERRKIQQQLEVIKRQREKGIDVYRSLKAKRDL
jgi:acyl-[acyl carrier protein]--UDP-N-acetylglucosamine O-acyltransferase